MREKGKSRCCVALNFPTQWIPIRHLRKVRRQWGDERKNIIRTQSICQASRISLPLYTKFFRISPGLKLHLLHNAHSEEAKISGKNSKKVY